MIPITATDSFIGQLRRAIIVAVTAGSLFYSGFAAADIPTIDTMVNNFSQDVPSLMRMVTAMAYVMGMWFVIKGVNALKMFGEQRTSMSPEHSLKGPLILLTVGAMLLYLPSTVNTGLNTLFAPPAVPYVYVVDTTNPYSVLIQSSFMILELIGVISFIRGLVLLTHLGGQGGQPGTFGRAMAHIVGGILCINMYDTVTAVLNTFGLGSVFS